ncbi:MAG: penicillin-binding protein 2 [Steroidobacteraceae bacterium]|nr:penicillin-binding protein 2 [Steroidobacteraceae bacterium]
MAGKGRIKDVWREQQIFEQRSLVAGVLIVLMTGALIARLGWLQISRNDYFTELSQGNRVRIEPLPAARGIIYDRNGTILAENRPAYQLELVREEVPDLEDTLQRLAAIGLIAPDEIDSTRRAIKSRRGFDSVPIRLRLSEEEIARFAVRRFEFPGVDIRTRLARYYPQGEVAVHALGHVGAISEKDLEKIDRAEYSGTATIGKLGIELAYESQLHGRNGSREILVNARGRSVEKQGALTPQLKTVPAQPGTDLVLSLDFEVQKVAEEAVWDQRAAIVAIDPQNGDVIALASRPGFDPNLFARGLTGPEFRALNENIDRPLFNRALRGVYPPGSTIKPLVALAGLTYQLATPQTSRYCRGWFSLPGSRHRFRDWKPQGHGTLGMVQAIAQSCDVYFYSLADEIGPTRLAEFLSHFGLGAPTGIDVGGEKAGLLPSPEWKRKAYRKPQDQVWFPGETVIFGIGQGYMLTTPVQLAHMTAIIGSRGKNFQPRLVTALRDPVTGTKTPVPPKLVEQVQVADAGHWQVAIDGMYAVTHGGTASRSAAGAEYSIAGKTGTAQVFTVAQNAKYDEKTIGERLRDHAWFVAFAPAEDPRIAVAVLVENGRSGSGTAAPIARKVMDAYLLRKFPPPPSAEESAAAAATTGGE